MNVPTLLCRIVFVCSASASIAQADEAANALYVAREFVGHCAQTAGRIDIVEAAANVLSYQLLDGDMKAMLGPQDPNVEYLGWFVENEEFVPYLLGVSEGPVNGVIFSNCVIGNPYIPMDLVLEQLRALIQFGELLDEIESNGQRYRVWSTEGIASGSFIAAVDAPGMGIFGGSISLSARKEN